MAIFRTVNSARMDTLGLDFVQEWMKGGSWQSGTTHTDNISYSSYDGAFRTYDWDLYGDFTYTVDDSTLEFTDFSGTATRYKFVYNYFGDDSPDETPWPLTTEITDFELDISFFNGSLTSRQIAEKIFEGADQIFGSDVNDYLHGFAGDDYLTAGKGSDTLNGGTGGDTMIGGTGDDNYFVDDARDVVTEYENEGRDSVSASIDYTLPSHIEYLGLLGTANINATGNGLNNRLYGNEGNNILDGGAGMDAMEGGLGDDTYIFDNVKDQAYEAPNQGTDTIVIPFSITLSANFENATLSGSANIKATGNAGSNVLIGNAAHNSLDGSKGADTMSGGKGNDRYYVDNIGDRAIETANNGLDTVVTTVRYSLAGTHVENIILTGGAARLMGNSLSNGITGGSGNDVLDGAAGNDKLDGGGGADRLLGGLGADQFVFTKYASSTVAATGRDTILDFARTHGDKINLSAMDADVTRSGDQAFKFIGSASFHDKAGELRYEIRGSDTFIYADKNGDGKADFSVMLDRGLAMIGSDFIL